MSYLLATYNGENVQIIISLLIDFTLAKTNFLLNCNTIVFKIHEPMHVKTNNLDFRPGPTETKVYSHKSRLGA